MATISEAFAIAVQHHQAGRLESAEQIYQQIVAAEPNHADALHLLGVVASQVGRFDLAAEYIGRAVALNGTEASFHNNLGNVLKAQGKLEEAIASYRRALELKPDFAECHCNLGGAFQSQGNLDAAFESYCRALELKRDYAEAHNDLGIVLQTQGRFAEAIDYYRRAIELKPDYAEAHNNLGAALQSQGKLDEAVESYQRALDLAPEGAEAHNNLGEAVKGQGKLEDALEHFRRSIRLRPENVQANSNLLYTLHFCPGHDAASIYDEHCQWNRRHAEPLAECIKPHINNATPDRRLRVGYVSPNFRLHTQAFFLTPLFSSHNQEQVEIFCYSDVIVPDDITANLRSYIGTWRTTNGLSDEEVAQLVRGDQIDILVDLTMHMASGRPMLFARKPAPVQVCWLAYPGTTGLTAIDYRLTDPYLDPLGMFDRFYAEESVRLLDTFWCYDPLTSEPAVNEPPSLTNGHITFGSLNNPCKLNEGTLELWSRVMRAVDRSQLIVFVSEGWHRERIREFFENEGIASDRITFVGRQSRLRYLEQYHQIDIGLDTLPYNGHTTSLDAFWMGVPVVTIVGETVVGRAGLSQLTNLGLPELIATSSDQFVSIAAELANDWKRLSQLRTSLRQRMEKSPLMDAPRFAANVEAAYRGMWQRWCAARNDSLL